MVTSLRIALILAVVGLLMAVPPVYTEPRQHSTSQLWTFPDTDVVADAKSKLTRRDNEICMRIHTRGLTEGAYTIWWFVFNNPEHCTSPLPVGDARCGGDDDFANPEVNLAALWATGGIVGPDGIGHFSACLEENTFPGQKLDDGPGLTDAQGAEIHLAVRSHCAAEYGEPALLRAQLTMFGGGCTETGGEALGPLGTCDCTNSQFAIHPLTKRQHEDD